MKWIRPIYEKSSFHRSVIEEIEDKKLRNAYATCRAITKRYAKTFYMATRFLPNHKQRSIFAIYALCRYLDDLVDEAEDLIEAKKISPGEAGIRIEQWKSKLLAAYEGEESNHAILNAFSDVLNTYYIPVKLPLMLMDGVCTDLRKNRFNDFNELYDYSYKVASVVGLMTAKVFGYENTSADKRAVDLGIAMQLTNIIRDVGEDTRRGRIYLPLDELNKFNLTEEEFLSGRQSTKMKELIRFQIERARFFYDRAEPGIEMLERDSRLPVYLASRNYSRILDKVEENNYDVFSERAYLNSTEKLRILPQVCMKLVY